MNVGYARVSTSSQNNESDREQFKIMMDFVREGIEAAKKKGVPFGRKAILGTKEKNIIYKQHEKGKSVAFLSKIFHVARNTIYRAIKDIAKKNMKHLIMSLTSDCYTMCCDAQTSGGLLVAIDPKDAKEYIKEVEDLTYGYSSIIGEVIPRGATPIIIH